MLVISEFGYECNKIEAIGQRRLGKDLFGGLKFSAFLEQKLSLPDRSVKNRKTSSANRPKTPNRNPNWPV
jgi:hypothetical protein